MKKLLTVLVLTIPLASWLSYRAGYHAGNRDLAKNVVAINKNFVDRHDNLFGSLGILMRERQQDGRVHEMNRHFSPSEGYVVLDVLYSKNTSTEFAYFVDCGADGQVDPEGHRVDDRTLLVVKQIPSDNTRLVNSEQPAIPPTGHWQVLRSGPDWQLVRLKDK